MKFYYIDSMQIKVRFNDAYMFNRCGLSTFRVIVSLTHVLTGVSKMYCQKQILTELKSRQVCWPVDDWCIKITTPVSFRVGSHRLMEIDIAKTVMIYLCSFNVRSTHFSFCFAGRISLFSDNWWNYLYTVWLATRCNIQLR
jgi:hypothetical protein